MQYVYGVVWNIGANILGYFIVKNAIIFGTCNIMYMSIEKCILTCTDYTIVY